MQPWRSPERAPEHGGGDDGSNPRGSGEAFVRSASFTGDPMMQGRNAPWDGR